MRIRDPRVVFAAALLLMVVFAAAPAEATETNVTAANFVAANVTNTATGAYIDDGQSGIELAPGEADVLNLGLAADFAVNVTNTATVLTNEQVAAAQIQADQANTGPNRMIATDGEFDKRDVLEFSANTPDFAAGEFGEQINSVLVLDPELVSGSFGTQADFAVSNFSGGAIDFTAGEFGEQINSVLVLDPELNGGESASLQVGEFGDDKVMTVLKADAPA